MYNFVLKEALLYDATTQSNVFCTFWTPIRPFIGLTTADFSAVAETKLIRMYNSSVDMFLC